MNQVYAIEFSANDISVALFAVVVWVVVFAIGSVVVTIATGTILSCLGYKSDPKTDFWKIFILWPVYLTTMPFMAFRKLIRWMYQEDTSQEK